MAKRSVLWLFWLKGNADKQKQAREFLEKQNVTLTRLDEKGNLDD
jgi:D-methionine transport system ATP-binding protein